MKGSRRVCPKLRCVTYSAHGENFREGEIEQRLVTADMGRRGVSHEDSKNTVE